MSALSPLGVPVRPDTVVEVKHLNFDYGILGGHKPVLKDVSFSLPRGSRMILSGDNGAGKSTLLRVLAGRHIHRDDAALILGRNAYYDNSLNDKRAYLASDWGRRSVAFTGHGCAMTADIPVREMMADTQARNAARRDRLVELLGVDLDWRMHMLSDGQRRRVQIMLQLLIPAPLLLLDEITTELDVITRQDFLTYMKVVSETEGVTVIYATHIFDGLDDWMTHMAYMTDGAMPKFGPIEAFPEFAARRAAGSTSPLLRTIEAWLREGRDAKKARGVKVLEDASGGAVDELRGAAGNGYLPGRFNSGFN